jgi:hypothetical protein
VSYFHLRYDNKPEQTIDPRREDFKTAESKFVVAVIEKKSGNLLDYWELPGAESTVAVVPEETAAAGVIEKTATGYSVLGTLFTISAAGKIVLATQ